MSEPQSQPVSEHFSVLDCPQALQAWEAIGKANRIGIISHRHPDPDTIGSNMALRKALTLLGKTVSSHCVHRPPTNCQVLVEQQNYQDQFNPTEFDLLISVDCGSLDQVAFELPSADQFPQGFINVDHHTSNNNFGSINLVHTHLSSTSEIIYLLLRFWSQPIDKFMATCLLFGLYYDTGSFMHSNCNARVMEIAGDLIACGAEMQTVIANLYHNFHEAKFHLWGDTLEKIKLTDHQNAVAVISNENLINSSACSEDISGLIDYVSMVKGSQFAVMINQDNSDMIRGSLRTRQNNLNLSSLAQTMGGGGHQKASGFSFPGKIEKQILWKITP